MAWHYAYFNKTYSYAEAQRNAQVNRLGLWADPNPINPYQWRKQKHKQASYEDYNSRKVQKGK